MGVKETQEEIKMQTSPGNPETKENFVIQPPQPKISSVAPVLATPPAPLLDAALSDEPSRALSPYASEASLKSAYRMARTLSASTLVPEAYRGEQNVPNVLIAMELAHRVGASVLMVMQNLHIIHGRPGWASQFLIATVNSSGRFSPLRFRFQGKEGTDEWGCSAFAKDRENNEECPGPVVTMAMAKAEGWYHKNGSKWKTMPGLMIIYRAAAFWTRIYAPELSLGMQTHEEVMDVAGKISVDVSEPGIGMTPGSTKTLEAELLGVKPQPPITVIDDGNGGAQ